MGKSFHSDYELVIEIARGSYGVWLARSVLGTGR